MIPGRHRHKLIDGLVIAMGKPRSESRPSYGGSDSEPDSEDPAEPAEDEDEGAPTDGMAADGEGGDDEEALKCADDAFRAVANKDRRGFVEAVRTIAGLEK